MIKPSTRRISFALILGAASLVAFGTAHAGVTGTDPCPAALPCVVGSTSGATTGMSNAAAVTQAALVMLGLS